MGEFFKPLRRKIGVLTIGLACVTVGGWMRSFHKVDMVNFPIGDREFSIASIDGKLDFAVISDFTHVSQFSCTTDDLARIRHLWSNPDGSLREVDPWSNGHVLLWRWDCGDFHFGASKLPAIQSEKDWMIPYWFLIVPLTLLAAWLLFSKPRVKAIEQTAQTTN